MKVCQIRKEAGVFKAPASLIIFYFFFVLLDLYTTWITTPDLKYESNWIINYFKLNWLLIILLALLFALGIGILFVVSSWKLNQILSDENFILQYKFNSYLQSLLLKKIFLSILVIIVFYSHFFISIVASITNFLNYIYLNHSESFLYKFALVLVHLQTFFSPYFHLYLNILIVVFVVFGILNKYKRCFIVAGLHK